MTGVEATAESDGHPTCREFRVGKRLPRVHQESDPVLWNLEGPTRDSKREQQSLNKHKVQLKS